MKRLTLIADNLLWLLAGLIVAVAISVWITFWRCPDKECVWNWLQIAVEFWGFVAAIVTFLAAWIDANRKPDLKFHFALEEEPKKRIAKLSAPLKLGQRKGINILVGLGNPAPVAARFIRVEIELEFLDEKPPTLALNWLEIINLTIVNAPDFEIVTRVKEKDFVLISGDENLIYGDEEYRYISRCNLTFDGTPPVIPKLAGYDLSIINCALRFRVSSDKQTTEARVPLTVHVQTE